MEHWYRLNRYGLLGSIRFWYDVWRIKQFTKAVKKLNRYVEARP